MHLLTLVISLLSCALGASAMGCSVGVSATPEPPIVTTPASTGTVTLRWLVAGTTSPTVCATFAATMLELVIYDAAGNQVATANAPCGSFAVTVELPEGSYTADATLVDDNSNARSVTKPLAAIEVVPGTDLAIDLDFPPSSIL